MDVCQIGKRRDLRVKTRGEFFTGKAMRCVKGAAIFRQKPENALRIRPVRASEHTPGSSGNQGLDGHGRARLEAEISLSE